MQYQAVNVPPSTNWRGNDGTWATFYLDIGNPAQQIEVLPATSLGTIWAISTGGCSSNQPYSVELCFENRGGDYDWTASNESSFAVGNVQYGLSFFSESGLAGPYVASGQEPMLQILDDVKFAVGTLPGQLIETYNYTFPYVGFLGLIDHHNRPNDDVYLPSILGSMNITSEYGVSPYWAYTAGSINQESYPASLVFGGYDAARGNAENVLSVQLEALSTRDKVVNLVSVSIKNDAGTIAGGSATFDYPMYIDSVVPEMWLPTPACDVFENAFGLTYNDNLGLYMISAAQHDEMTKQNATVELELSANSSSSESITISLPYLAFVQYISYPLAGIKDTSSLLYFPLRVASSDAGQYQMTLGRVFLQGAYLAVDYNRTQFYVSQAQFPSDYASDIKTVYPLGVHPPAAPTPTITHLPSHLPPGEVAGVVVGSVAFLAIVLVLLWWFVYRPWARDRRNRRLSGHTVRTEQIERAAGGHNDFMGYYGDEEKKHAEDEMYEKRELDAGDTARPSIASPHEMPSPPLPQYSPGSRSPGSPGSPHSHLRNISADSAELPGDYLTARRLSPVGAGPWELQGDNLHARSMSPIEIGFGSRQDPNPSTNF